MEIKFAAKTLIHIERERERKRERERERPLTTEDRADQEHELLPKIKQPNNH